jgi:DnaK suppressor protein
VAHRADVHATDESGVADVLRKLLTQTQTNAVVTRRQLEELSSRDVVQTAVIDAVEGVADADVLAARLTLMSHATEAIARTLARIDSGDYGVCEDCQRRISARRLAAVPFALRCFDCQSRWESEHQFRR